jgi:hypothetical protein
MNSNFQVSDSLEKALNFLVLWEGKVEDYVSELRRSENTTDIMSAISKDLDQLTTWIPNLRVDTSNEVTTVIAQLRTSVLHVQRMLEKYIIPLLQSYQKEYNFTLSEYLLNLLYTDDFDDLALSSRVKKYWDEIFGNENNIGKLPLILDSTPKSDISKVRNDLVNMLTKLGGLFRSKFSYKSSFDGVDDFASQTMLYPQHLRTLSNGTEITCEFGTQAPGAQLAGMVPVTQLIQYSSLRPNNNESTYIVRDSFKDIKITGQLEANGVRTTLRLPFAFRWGSYILNATDCRYGHIAQTSDNAGNTDVATSLMNTATAAGGVYAFRVYFGRNWLTNGDYAAGGTAVAGIEGVDYAQAPFVRGTSQVAYAYSGTHNDDFIYIYIDFGTTVANQTYHFDLNLNVQGLVERADRIKVFDGIGGYYYISTNARLTTILGKIPMDLSIKAYDQYKDLFNIILVYDQYLQELGGSAALLTVEHQMRDFLFKEMERVNYTIANYGNYGIKSKSILYCPIIWWSGRVAYLARDPTNANDLGKQLSSLQHQRAYQRLYEIWLKKLSIIKFDTKFLRNYAEAHFVS